MSTATGSGDQGALGSGELQRDAVTTEDLWSWLSRAC